jgi:hypothetical protein
MQVILARGADTSEQWQGADYIHHICEDDCGFRKSAAGTRWHRQTVKAECAGYWLR